MSVSGVGGVGIGAGVAGMSFGGTAGISGVSAASAAGSPAAPGGADLQVGMPPNLQSLVDSMKDFNSAQILIALMIAAAANKDDENKSSSAAAGFLAGLAMAGGLGQANQAQMNIEVTGIQMAGGDGAGLSLNVSV